MVISTSKRHKLLKYQYGAQSDRWRALCADCDFKGKWETSPDKATDCFTEHQKESESYADNTAIHKRACEHCGQSIVLMIDGKLGAHRTLTTSPNSIGDWCPGGGK